MNDLSPLTLDRMHSLVQLIHSTKIHSMKILPEYGNEPTSVRLGFKAMNKEGFLKSRTRDFSISTYQHCKHFIEASGGGDMLRLTEAGVAFLKDKSTAQ